MSLGRRNFCYSSSLYLGGERVLEKQKIPPGPRNAPKRKEKTKERTTPFERCPIIEKKGGLNSSKRLPTRLGIKRKNRGAAAPHLLRVTTKEASQKEKNKKPALEGLKRF